jgi:hypothetical protein
MTFAGVLVEPESAAHEAFPGAVTTKKTEYLTEAQVAKIESLAGSAPSSRIVVTWRAQKDGAALGVAYLESHIVRTASESILVVLDANGSVRRVEILSFDEPAEYLPKPKWLDQFQGRSLDSDLSLKGGVRGITGATLSSRAITSAVRRVLATQGVLAEAAGGSKSAPGATSPATNAPPSTKPGASSGAPAGAPPPAKRPAPSGESAASPPPGKSRAPSNEPEGSSPPGRPLAGTPLPALRPAISSEPMETRA